MDSSQPRVRPDPAALSRRNRSTVRAIPGWKQSSDNGSLAHSSMRTHSERGLRAASMGSLVRPRQACPSTSSKQVGLVPTIASPISSSLPTSQQMKQTCLHSLKFSSDSTALSYASTILHSQVDMLKPWFRYSQEFSFSRLAKMAESDWIIELAIQLASAASHFPSEFLAAAEISFLPAISRKSRRGSRFAKCSSIRQQLAESKLNLFSAKLRRFVQICFKMNFLQFYSFYSLYCFKQDTAFSGKSYLRAAHLSRKTMRSLSPSSRYYFSKCSTCRIIEKLSIQCSIFRSNRMCYCRTVRDRILRYFPWLLATVARLQRAERRAGMTWPMRASIVTNLRNSWLNYGSISLQRQAMWAQSPVSML